MPMPERRLAAAKDRDAPQMDLFDSAPDPDWPPFARFPYNHARQRVRRAVREDLLRSEDPLIITGYASLDRVVDFLAAYRRSPTGGLDRFSSIRILFGHEPRASLSDASALRPHDLAREVKNYWLDRGISLHLCASVLDVLELLDLDRIEVRASAGRSVHAKIYKADDAVTVGSSNFSRAGLDWQIEGNARFTREAEESRYREASTLAEAVWEFGTDWKDGLRALLEQLLRPVTWQEALARACAELLEGAWARRYLDAHTFGDAQKLWPAQKEGIAQAMWVLENIGSVLVADATGSGKTRMGAHLIRGLQLRNWRTGRIRRDIPVLVCPPSVAQHWEHEATRCGQAVKVYSHGVLSNIRAAAHDDTIRAVRRAQILAVDEAHNFLNPGANRTRTLYANMADHVLLFTATPINKGPHDLLPIIDLLGGDNFDPGVLRTVARVWGRRHRSSRERMSSSERDVVSKAIQRFTVRRTKRMLNEAVDVQPDEYRNALGKQCRYPDHVAKMYPCGETARDRELAREIRDLAGRLRGITYFQATLELPEYLRREGWDDARYLAQRLNSAGALASYHVADSLRSSKAALLEHIHGTVRAKELCGIEEQVKPSPTGDAIGNLRKIEGRIPHNELHAALPVWLRDSDSHAEACNEEIRIYEAISQLARTMSDVREETKAQRLDELLDRHERVLAFDSHLISLSDMRVRLDRLTSATVLLATGQTRSARKEVNDVFDLASDARNVIALCSDALSEGVNLQGASVVVHLDMPSVIRVAEQRIGRVDRMDSPHREIEVYWPADTAEFALRSDEIFLERHQDVKDLIGSNVPLPEHLRSMLDARSGPLVRAEDYAAQVERVAEDRVMLDGIKDAFEPVRSLISGENPLVAPTVYDQLKDVSAAVLSCVSVVTAPTEWSFYAIAGSERAAPRWIFLDDDSTQPVTDLDNVAQMLRAHLSGEVEEREVDDHATGRIERDLTTIRRSVVQLLPRKKRRALEEMKEVLACYRESAAAAGDIERERVTIDMLSLMESEVTQAELDLSALAEWWIDLIRPTWYDYLTSHRRRRPALLKDIRKQLIKSPLETEKLESLWKIPLRIQPIDERVVAAIVGVPG